MGIPKQVLLIQTDVSQFLLVYIFKLLSMHQTSRPRVENNEHISIFFHYLYMNVYLFLKLIIL